MIYISINIYISTKHCKMDVNSGDYMGTWGSGGYLHLPGQGSLAGRSNICVLLCWKSGSSPHQKGISGRGKRLRKVQKSNWDQQGWDLGDSAREILWSMSGTPSRPRQASSGLFCVEWGTRERFYAKVCYSHIWRDGEERPCHIRTTRTKSSLQFTKGSHIEERKGGRREGEWKDRNKKGSGQN